MEHSNSVTEALSNIVAQQPFFAVYLYNQMNIKEDSTIKTANTDGNTMSINPEWFGKMPIEERVFVGCHEICHGIMDHMGRGKLYNDRGFGPDLKPYHQKTANDAMDYIINAMLKEAGIGSMPASGLWSPDITGDMLFDEVYMDLNAKRYDPESEDKSDGGQGESGDGDDSAPSDGDGSGDREEGFDEHVAPASGEEKNEQEQKTAIAQASQAAEAQGKMPASLKRQIGALVDPELTWKELLRGTITARQGQDTSTWSRLNRRRLAVAPHIAYPGRTGWQIGGLGIEIDLSGSINQPMLDAFMGECAGILNEVKAEWIKVFGVNSEVTGEYDIDSPDDLMECPLVGGGGTDMEVLSKYLDDENIMPEHVIIFTDGITSFSKTNPFDCDVTWVLTTDRREPPYGTVINMKL